MKIAIGIIFIIFSLCANADTYQAGPIKVESLRIAKNGIYARFKPALSACEGGNHYRMHTLAPNTQQNYDVLASSLIAAYVAQIDLSYVFVNNEGTACSSSHILNLDMIEYANK